jgi:hypothetical protein
MTTYSFVQDKIYFKITERFITTLGGQSVTIDNKQAHLSPGQRTNDVYIFTNWAHLTLQPNWNGPAYHIGFHLNFPKHDGTTEIRYNFRIRSTRRNGYSQMTWWNPKPEDKIALKALLTEIISDFNETRFKVRGINA